ncbi:MAG: BadF/BadG/BcrA/BcrD ATPase family protein [Candidatus Sulfotelmatobacter sp.]
MAYFLGIDGGGSKTTCVVGDEVAVLARVTTGPSNINRVGETRARESLHEGIRQACEAAGIDPGQVQRACVGVAGVGNEETANAVRKMVAEVLPAKIEVVGDMQIALEAAFGEGPGVIVIAGTGSIAYGRDAQGKTARAGGWGFAVSDEGSAHWIGRTAVAALLRAVDRSASLRDSPDGSALFREIQGTWNLRSLEALVCDANLNGDFAALFPAVLAAAEQDDWLAQQVLLYAGRELAQLASIIARALFPENSVLTIPLGIVGGVFAHSKRVREIFREEAAKLDPRVTLNPEIIDPVAGALAIARKAAKS